MKRNIVLIVFLLVSLCSAFEISPLKPNPSDKITLTGTASPGEQVDFRSSFQIELPVNENKYEYETSVEIPQKPNRFTVTVSNIKDINAGVKIILWITKRFEASDGRVTISQADIPPGKYNLRMFGVAQDGASKVPVEIVAETTVIADSQGKYKLVIDTTGMPSGDYEIEGEGDTKTVRIGGSAFSSGGDGKEENSGSYEKQEFSESQVTEETIKWYATELSLDPQESKQYAEAERLLKKRLSEDYWRIIAKGEPLTEEAGNCEENYCLVRGVDACRECREKDILIKSSKKSDESDIVDENNKTFKNLSHSSAAISISVENNNPIRRFLEWILSILGMSNWS